MSSYSFVISSAGKRLPRGLLSSRALFGLRLYSDEKPGDAESDVPTKIDPKKTEAKAKLSDLLNRVKLQNAKDRSLKPIELKAKPVKKVFEKKDESSSSSGDDSSSSDDEEPIDQDLKVIAKRAAAVRTKNVVGDDDAKYAAQKASESALLKKLRSISNETAKSQQESQVAGSTDTMSSLFSSMKVAKSSTEEQKTLDLPSDKKFDLSPEQREFLSKRRLMRSQKRMADLAATYEAMDYFKVEAPLGIFSKSAEKPSSSILQTWPTILERETKILLTQQPRNLIEDMADMTDRGILWHFPINNEQGLSEEEVIVRCYSK